MTDDELPPPPSPHNVINGVYLYSLYQMHDYGKACAQAAAEYCAQVVEGPLGLVTLYPVPLARVIRSLRWKS